MVTNIHTIIVHVVHCLGAIGIKREQFFTTQELPLYIIKRVTLMMGTEAGVPMEEAYFLHNMESQSKMESV